MTEPVDQSAPSGIAAPIIHLPRIPAQPAPAIDSRFLFVDVAAMRAKQLRRGALVRLDKSEGRFVPHKLERMAMEEVKMQLVEYTLPEVKVPTR
jgi:DNA-directed RNA polymerase subunit K/omega